MSPTIKLAVIGVVGATAGEVLAAYAATKLPSVPEWALGAASELLCIIALLKLTHAAK